MNEASEPIATAVYDAVADLYDRAFADIRVRRAEVAWLSERLAHSKLVAPRVLDLGCGTGALLRELSPTIGTGVGVDVSGAMLAHALRRGAPFANLSFERLERVRLPFEDNRFDVVVSLLSFRYLDWNRIFPEILRVLRPGGRFLMVDLVRAPADLGHGFALVRSTLRHLRRTTRSAFQRDLSALVRHPEWKRMLAQHPMRDIAEYRDFFAAMLPSSRFDTLDVLPKRRVIALDSGPLGS